MALLQSLRDKLLRRKKGRIRDTPTPTSPDSSIKRKPLPANAQVDPRLSLSSTGGQGFTSKSLPPIPIVSGGQDGRYWALEAEDAAGAHLPPDNHAAIPIVNSGHDGRFWDQNNGQQYTQHGLSSSTGQRNATHPNDSRSSDDQDETHQTPLESQTLKDLAGGDDSVDTDYHTRYAPAVTHETTDNVQTEIIQEHITRDIHEHDYHQYVLPVTETEVLPTKHFVLEPDGTKREISTYLGERLEEQARRAY